MLRRKPPPDALAFPHPADKAPSAGRIALFAAALSVSSFALFQHEANQDRALRSQKDVAATLEEDIQRQQYQLGRMADAAAAATGVSEEALLGSYLRAPEQLPGYNQAVSKEKRQLLEQATVELVKRPKGSSDSWQPSCTAVKVSVNNVPFITTAAHCFYTDFPAGEGKGGGEPMASAANISGYSQYEYAITKPRPQSEQDGTNKLIASVSAISIDISGTTDWALMRVSDAPGIDPADFAAIKSAQYQAAVAAIPGQEAFLYSHPQANNHTPVAGTGTYLGRILEPGYHDRYIDLVGIADITDPRADACNYGASGSSAMFAEGYLSGPLQGRNHITYGSHELPNPLDNPQVAQQVRFLYEEALRIDLSSFTTICGFSVAQETTAGDLLHGFDTPYEQLRATMQDRSYGQK